jgi:hypothetical protein
MLLFGAWFHKGYGHGLPGRLGVVGADVVITARAADAVTLRNVQFSSLHEDNFRFV